MEARPPAENRHGGAPRGERPASWDAPRLTSADRSRLANATTDIVRLSALRPPLHSGMDAKGKARTRAQQRAAGTNNTALFDIVNMTAANGSCASRAFACQNRLILRKARSACLEGWAATEASCFETLAALAPQHEDENGCAAERSGAVGVTPYALRCSGTLPPVSASLVMTCRCSQTFISAEPSSAPV